MENRMKEIREKEMMQKVDSASMHLRWDSFLPVTNDRWRNLPYVGNAPAIHQYNHIASRNPALSVRKYSALPEIQSTERQEQTVIQKIASNAILSKSLAIVKPIETSESKITTKSIKPLYHNNIIFVLGGNISVNQVLDVEKVHNVKNSQKNLTYCIFQPEIFLD
jgi:hypothetical protein